MSWSHIDFFPYEVTIMQIYIVELDLFPAKILGSSEVE